MRGATGRAFSRRISSDATADNVAAGGDVLLFIAAAALLIGDVVYLSAANTVNKSNTPANQQKFIGVVVGGVKTTFGQCGTLPADVGNPAAATGEDVLVQVNGKAWVAADAAVAATGLVTQGATTAGRVDDSASATQGQIIGIALQAATNPNDKILILINHM